VSDPLHDNLALLYSAFSEEVIDAILPGESFSIDGVEFVCQYKQGSTAGRFYIVKSLALVEAYRRLCEQVVEGAIVELGIAEGGSTALLALLAHPEKLIAIDLEPSPLAALSEFISTRGLEGSVRPHYGVDQSDRVRLAELVDQDLEGAPLDLVIDDCSHQYLPTRASFETLFPRLRPGGLYVIEDWNAHHVTRDAVRAELLDTTAPDHEERVERFRRALRSSPPAGETAPQEPLTRLALELFVARCSLTDVIAKVSVDEFWIVVERGDALLDPSTFRLEDHYTDHFGFLSSS
jgi:predicted O-methyltransferase YrrM